MSDKSFYDNDLDGWNAVTLKRDFRPYIDDWLPQLRRHFAPRNDVRVLELGAGSCTSSLVVSQEPWVGRIVATDISEIRLKQMSGASRDLVGGDVSKIDFVEANFNELLPFGDSSFDFILMDAALHHARNIWQILAEIRRVLVPHGVFVAQREAYTSPLTNWITFRRLLASPEVAAAVSENAYLKSQYDYYLRANGFDPVFRPVFSRLLFKILFFANGWLFSKYNIIARSTKESADREV